ncbi:MAG: hypothetical protein HRT90_02795, partial [Candidatus Margulisbacteria bacterium]|nr:hypothetical protein [Candidatus Margulisiibacteriota bacterium]
MTILAKIISLQSPEGNGLVRESRRRANSDVSLSSDSEGIDSTPQEDVSNDTNLLGLLASYLPIEDRDTFINAMCSSPNNTDYKSWLMAVGIEARLGAPFLALVQNKIEEYIENSSLKNDAYEQLYKNILSIFNYQWENDFKDRHINNPGGGERISFPAVILKLMILLSVLDGKILKK